MTVICCERSTYLEADSKIFFTKKIFLYNLHQPTQSQSQRHKINNKAKIKDIYGYLESLLHVSKYWFLSIS
jgi:hypothetical protein